MRIFRRRTFVLRTVDVTNDKHIEHAAKEIEATVGDRGLNLLINNAGILEREGSLIPTVKRAVVNDHFNINVTSAILVTQVRSTVFSE